MTRKEKVSEHTRKWASRNKDKILEKNRRYREANREKICAYQAAFRARMTPEARERALEYGRAWRAKHQGYAPERGPRKPTVPRKKIEVPRLPAATFSMTVSCPSCDKSMRRGSPDLLDWELYDGELTCPQCVEILEEEL